MNHKMIKQLCEAKGLTDLEVASTPAWAREAIGLPRIVPHVDYNRFQRFVDNYLPRRVTLRRLFGLDQVMDTDPPFTFEEPGAGRNYSWYESQLRFEMDRQSIYRIVEEMDTFDLASTALDIYAEESTQTDEDTGRAIWVDCEDARIKRELMNLYDRLLLEDKAFGIFRSLCKYGDVFETIIASPSRGIVALKYIPPQKVTRVEDNLGILKGFAPGILTDMQLHDAKAMEKIRIAEPWKVIHWRIQSSRLESTHGETVLMAARRVHRQLRIIEDALVLYRLNRATDKDIYYIDVGTQSPDQQWQTVHRFRRELRKKFYVNTETGQMRQQYDPRTVDEDLYIPLPKDSVTKVERLSGANPQGDILDVEHFRDKFFAAVKIPKAFAGYEKDVNAKATLVSQDIRFARSIKRVQRAGKHGLTWLSYIHLSLRGYEVMGEDGEYKIKIKVRMAPINFLEEEARAEVFSIKHDITMKMLELVQPMIEPPQPTEPSATTTSRRPAPTSSRSNGKKSEAISSSNNLMERGTFIKNVDNYVSWVLRRFLGFGDDEMEYFMGDRDAGRTPMSQELRDLTEGKFEALSRDGGLDTIRDRSKLVKEAHKVLQEDEDQDFTFEALPSKEDVEAWKEALEKAEKEEGVWDLEGEEKRLMEVLGESINNPKIACPSCKKFELEHKFDKVEDRSYLRCKECGFAAYADNA